MNILTHVNQRYKCKQILFSFEKKKKKKKELQNGSYVRLKATFEFPLPGINMFTACANNSVSLLTAALVVQVTLNIYIISRSI